MGHPVLQKDSLKKVQEKLAKLAIIVAYKLTTCGLTIDNFDDLELVLQQLKLENNKLTNSC